MKRFGLRTYALSGGVAAALLAGCGGSQLPLGSSVADEVAAPTRDATHDYRVIYSFKGGRKADGSGPGALTAMNGTLSRYMMQLSMEAASVASAGASSAVAPYF